MNDQAHSHLRQNLLTGEWVLVSPHRTQRPWQGQVEEIPPQPGSRYDPNCYLCPGNERAKGQRNPGYSGPYAFDNDFPALSAAQQPAHKPHPLFVTEAVTGCCRVICFSEKHDMHLAGMTVAEIAGVLRFLSEEFRALDARPDIAYVQAFENRGEMMGCSNPHPHAQVWATSEVPEEPAKELRCQQKYMHANRRSLLLDYLAAEDGDGSRLVHSNSHAASMVPFWATWPFETLLMPRRQVTALDEMESEELAGFAEVLKVTIEAYDRLFGVPMPYSMGLHPRPSDGNAHPEWQFHIHMYPPLLRSATVRKHMVGFEMMGMPQRDLTPEAAAEQIRAAIP